MSLLYTKHASGTNIKFNPSMDDDHQFVYNHWVFASLCGIRIPRGNHKPSSQ